MKILMLGWELPPLNSGGLGVACYHLCQHLADKGVDIDFVMPYPIADEHRPSFMNVHTFDDGMRIDASSSYFIGGYANWSDELQNKQSAYLNKVQQLVLENDYDAIHCHDWLTLQAAVYAKKVTGLPLVAHVHSTEFDRAGQLSGNPIVHEIEYNCLLMADQIVAVSNATKNVLVEKYQIPPCKIDVVYSGIDPAALCHPPEASSYTYLKKMQARGYKVVVSLGRLTVQKGLYYLLHAAQRAIKMNPKILFLIVGDGEQRNELIALSAELGIAENIIFTGFLRGKQWRDAYAIGDMFVMSSVSEPYGLTALEAACVGTAIIMTKQSGVSEVLNNSLRFDFWDTAKLADYIVNVAEQPALQNQLAQNAKHEVQHITWHKAAAKLLGLYQRLSQGVQA